MNKRLKKHIDELVNKNKVFLFMKGTPNEPKCGFSAKAVSILNNTGVEFGYFNVLENQEVREGIKEYGNWPTIPQIYFKGNLIGGCDILMELEENKELKKTLELE